MTTELTKEERDELTKIMSDPRASGPFSGMLSNMVANKLTTQGKGMSFLPEILREMTKVSLATRIHLMKEAENV